MRPVLDIEALTKVYKGGLRANDGITLNVKPGEVFGLLGHNGAGKTTLLNQVIGLARPTSGTIHVDGHDAIADPDAARRLCAFQPQAQAPVDGVRPREVIRLIARLRGADRRTAARRTDELLEALDITDWADSWGDKLSGGVKRLVAFCMAAVQPGRIVMFDEPTNDVDPVRRRLLWQQIRAIADTGSAVLLVTHNVIEAEKAVDRLIILDHGRTIAAGTPAQLRGADADRLRLDIATISPEHATGLADRFGGNAVGRRVLATVPDADVSAVLDRVRDEKTRGTVEEFSIGPIGLEDVYIRLVGDGAAREGADHAALVA